MVQREVIWSGWYILCEPPLDLSLRGHTGEDEMILGHVHPNSTEVIGCSFKQGLKRESLAGLGRIWVLELIGYLLLIFLIIK